MTKVCESLPHLLRKFRRCAVCAKRPLHCSMRPASGCCCLSLSSLILLPNDIVRCCRWWWKCWSCDPIADHQEMVSRKIYVTYSPNCKQFPAEGTLLLTWEPRCVRPPGCFAAGHMINLMIAPTLRRIWPYEAGTPEVTLAPSTSTSANYSVCGPVLIVNT